MKKLRLALAVGLPLVLGACAVARPPAQVQAPTPSQWQAPLPHGGEAAQLSEWWRQLDDPLLSEFIEAAQRVSPTLASALSRLEQARATRVAAGAALWPALDARASISRGNAQPPLPLATTAQAGLQASWELDLFGGQRDAVQASQARLRAAEAGWHDARVSVAAETASSYYNLRSCQRQLEVAERDAASRGETARLSQLSTDAGFTAPASNALARASAAEATARLKQQRAQCELEIKTLVALTGLDEAGLRTRTGAASPLPDADTPDLFAVSSLPAQVLAQRPDVFQAEAAVAAASADVGSAQAARYPRLSLSGSITAGHIRTGTATNAQLWSIGPLALSVPVFDAGRRAADARSAQARYDEAVALYGARVRQAVREVEQALVTLDAARARSADARTAVAGYSASFNATEARYRTGLASQVELEDARRLLLAAETTLVGLQREIAQAWISLYRAAGGGWQRDEAMAPQALNTNNTR